MTAHTDDDGTAAPSRPADPRELLTRTALGVFRLNGEFVSVSDGIAREAGLTAARWQVLGAVVRAPATVAGIARTMGITRQSVQRIADVLVGQGLAAYGDNPAHRRAKLLRATGAGREAVGRLGPGHSALAHRLQEELGQEGFAETVRVLERLSRAMEAIGSGGGREPAARPAGPGSTD
ncbi:MarR family winged helix-turn-helix transcriptional regulator [Streptomyces zhihengii]